MLFVLNIDGLVINYINSNDQINKRVIFEFVNFDTTIIRVVFELANTVEYLYVDTT